VKLPDTLVINEVKYVREDGAQKIPASPGMLASSGISALSQIQVSPKISAVVPTKKQIVLLKCGWVVVGDVEKTVTEIIINNCSVIWGTSKRSGQLAKLAREGINSNTEIDPCPPLVVHPLSVVFYMNVNEENWKRTNVNEESWE